MDIGALVRAVISAFEDASKLVNRIREQREKSEHGALPEEPTRDLLESLALGPVIVRGHYDHDLKRFGEQYACGDIQAREQMKDVLINLQMTLIITLRSVWMDDMELDFNVLQTASDDCRVNAGVCLGQLSQRLSDAAKAQAMYPQNLVSESTLLPPMSPSLAYSSSRSTGSSKTFAHPRTPDMMPDQFANMSFASAKRPPYTDRKLSGSSGGSQSPFPGRLTTTLLKPDTYVAMPHVGVHRVQETDANSLRRRSSHTLAPEDSVLLSPTTSGPPEQPSPGALPGAQDIDRESYVSSGYGSSSPEMSRAHSARQSTNSREHYDPEDFSPSTEGRQFSYGTIYDMSRPTSNEQPAPTSYSSRAQDSNHSTLEHIRYLQENSRPPMHSINHVPLPMPLPTNPPRQEYSYSTTPARKPVATLASSLRSPYSGDTPNDASQVFNSRPSLSAPIPLEAPSQHTANPPPPIPQAPAPTPSTTNPMNRSTTAISFHSATSSSFGPLNLPTDKNLQGFCKGAFRLQIGLEKKAFSVANRPAGFSGMIPYWRCEKCNFEGPVVTSVIVEGKKRGKPEKCFDPKVRVSDGGGVRYRWAFLAKSHVTLKGLAEGSQAKEGTFGSFGCLFCCAEGAQRGWTNNSGLNGGEAASVRSGKSGSVGGGAGMPIFGNITSFMEHLEMHRREEGWPNAEMQGRAKCVVGKVAGMGEDWDVNFTPV